MAAYHIFVTRETMQFITELQIYASLNNHFRGADRRSAEATIYFSGRQSCPIYWSVRSTKPLG